MTIDKASFDGIFFYLRSYEFKDSFHNETIEFVSDHPPEVKTYKKQAREIPVSGFLFGNDSSLARDLLLKVCSSPTAKTLYLPQIGFLNAICVSLSIQESDNDPGLLEIKLQFKEVAEKPKLSAQKFLSEVENLNSLIDDFALKTIHSLEVISQTAYGIKRITDSVSKVHSLFNSVNGLGIFTAPFSAAEETAQKLQDLVKAPKRLLEAIFSFANSLSSLQAERSILGLNAAQIAPISHYVKLVILQKLPVDLRRSVFLGLVDSLPTEDGIKLFTLEPKIFPREITERKWKPCLSQVSLLAAFISGDLELELEIIERNNSVFFCKNIPS